ncbi:MAG: glycosyltransferase [Pseudomonadota bacterium]
MGNAPHLHPTAIAGHTGQSREAWIVGTFSLTGAEMPRHAAELSALLAAGGMTPRLVGVTLGTFAEAHLDDAARLPRTGIAVIYLRAILRPPLRGERGWALRLGRLRNAVRSARFTYLLVDPPARRGLMHGLAARALALALGPRTQRLNASLGAARIAARILGRNVPTLPPGEAEERAFARILAARPQGQRLSVAHVMRARNLAACSAALREDLAVAADLAAGVDARWLATSLRALTLACEADAPDPVQICLAPARRGAGTRLAEHFRLAGQPARAARAMPRPLPRPTTPAERLIQPLLAGTAEPGLAGRYHRPLGDEAGNLSVLELTLLLAARRPMTSLAAFRAPWRQAAWGDELERMLGLGHPARADRGGGVPTFRLHGLGHGETGLHRNLWMSADAAARAGLAPQVMGPAPHVPLAVPSGPPRRLRADVALHHLNADRIPEAILEGYRHRTAYQIGYLLWELDRLPAAHRLALEMLDEIWVPSTFLAHLYRRETDRPVVLMKKALPRLTPAPSPVARQDRFRALVAFDARSSVARKNPIAAVSAFCQAFEGRHDVELIVKSTPVPETHWGDPEGQMAAIRAVAARDARVRLIEADLPFAELLGLISGSSVLISPHRAEGFGYLPAFALALGTPVIATDWSGTRDICTEDTAFPVPFSLREVAPQQAIFAVPGARWAEVNTKALAETLIEVANAPAAARARAAAGQELLAREYSADAHAARYLARLERLELLTSREDDALRESS